MADLVGASLEVMDRDAKKMRGDKPFVFSNMKTKQGLDDIIQFIEKEGMLLGHNIKRFDLPVLKDSLDCWTASDILFKSPDTIFDTSVILKSIIGHAIPLSDTVHHTLGKDKLMNSHDAPLEWRRGQYGKVAKYCLDDAKLVSMTVTTAPIAAIIITKV